jgi:gas vesicle protein
MIAMSEDNTPHFISRSLFWLVVGTFFGAGISLLYAPSSGDKTRQYLRLQTERVRRKARQMNEGIKENIENLVDEVREIREAIIREGIDLTKEKKAELIAAIEAGKKTMEDEKKRLEQHRIKGPEQ